MYRTRQRGIRLPAPAEGVPGHLHLALWRVRHARELCARLTTEHDSLVLLLPELLPARVERITRQGIVIAGTEVIPRRAGSKKSGADRYPQTWWCLVHAMADTPFPPGGGLGWGHSGL